MNSTAASRLIRSILDNATVPYVIDGGGNCHVYVDESADLDMATEILVNAKMQRPSVCNAAESLVVHAAVADRFLPRAVEALVGVDLVGDERARAVVPGMGEASEDDWSTEYADLKLSVRVVDDLDEAIRHVNETGSGHSEAIVTADEQASARFAAEVDAAAVLVNASTRFVDGEEFGFGAEIGISTQKLHARGPMGLGADPDLGAKTELLTVYETGRCVDQHGRRIHLGSKAGRGLLVGGDNGLAVSRSGLVNVPDGLVQVVDHTHG
jgi:glutamate-5-semialdehyde dehydrogenase